MIFPFSHRQTIKLSYVVFQTQLFEGNRNLQRIWSTLTVENDVVLHCAHVVRVLVAVALDLMESELLKVVEDTISDGFRT